MPPLDISAGYPTPRKRSPVASGLLRSQVMNFREIVLPTDFSPASEAASRVARDLAMASGARLHLVHVVPPVTDPGSAGSNLAREATRLGGGLTTNVALLHGRAAHRITTYARERGADLIVMGTHGRTGFSRRLLGSVAEAVVRTASCPVLTVPAPSQTEGSVAVSVRAEPLEERCVVCAKTTEDLICAECRAHIRGEALEQKLRAERAGRQGVRV